MIKIKFKYSLVLIAVVLFLFSGCYSNNIIKKSYFNLHKKKFIAPVGYDKKKFTKIFFKESNFSMNLYAENFKQGNLVYAEIFFDKLLLEKEITNVELFFNNKKVNLFKKRWGYRSFFAISPKAKIGKKSLIFNYDISGKNYKKEYFVNIFNGNFPVFKSPLFFGKRSNVNYAKKPEILKLISESRKDKKEAFSFNTEDKIGQNVSHPRNRHFITSPFWAKRVYFRYKKNRKGKKVRLKNKVKIHRGIDLRGRTGEPVYSIISGKVVMSRFTFYGGNMIIIDHGGKIFSYFMHLDKRFVQKGDTVYAGDKIANVGSTGRSTAPHLHVSLLVNGIQVNPLSILSLPIRN